MAIPIPVQPTPLPATDKQIERAEQILDAIVRVIANGTTGASVNTPPTYAQSGSSEPTNLVLSKPEQQTFFRQLATVMSVMEATSSGGDGGITQPPVETNATCSPTDQVGDLVRVSTTGTVTKADITDWNKMPAVGCIVSKSSPTSCVIQTGNQVSLYTGLIPGKVYFVGFNSRPVYPRPIPAPGSSIFIQSIGLAVNSTTIMIAPGTTVFRVFN